MISSCVKMKAAARDSELSQLQVEEFKALLQLYLPHIQLETLLIKTQGDLDQHSSLRSRHADNFFTREIDELVLSKKVDIGIHSAKDLPQPLPEGLEIVALTKSIDPRDCLVMKKGGKLKAGTSIACSSKRREQTLNLLSKGLRFIDCRGTIRKRLELLDQGIGGVVIAKAALLRLNIKDYEIIDLPGPTPDHQGQLAIVARPGQFQKLFSPIDFRQGRPRVLYLGTDPRRWQSAGCVWHKPIIEPVAKTAHPKIEAMIDQLSQFSHLLLSSPQAAKFFFHYLKNKKITCPIPEALVIGEGTAQATPLKKQILSPGSTAEDFEPLLKKLPKDAKVLYPHSELARPLIKQLLTQHQIEHFAIDLYTTRAKAWKEPLCLNRYDEIVFTSPSCVKSFFERHSTWPFETKMTAIGPITEKELNKFL